MPVSLSVVYLSYNEEGILGTSLQSVAKLADEIVVVDSGSIDSTQAIAKKYGAKVFERPLENWGEQRNWALDQCSHSWVLVLDCDEVVSLELAKSIQSFKDSEPTDGLYSFKRTHVFMDKRMRYSGLQNDWIIRLMPKSTRFEALFVHEKVHGKAQRIAGEVIHYTFKSTAHWTEKMRHYAIRQAKDYNEKTQSVTAWHKIVKPSFRFFKHYVLKGGIFDGLQGLHYSLWMYRAVKWRYQELEKLRMR